MSVVRWLVVASVVPLALGSAVARAQGAWPMPVEDPALASLLEEALSKNPDVAAARGAAEAAGERPAQARSLANPVLSVGYTNDGWPPSLGEMPMTTLAFVASQDLPFPGKRGLRGEIAAREAEEARRRAERVGRSLTASVKRAYYGLVLSRGLLAVTREQKGLWSEIEGVARARYSVGQGAQQDVLRVQVELTRVEQLLAEQEGEEQVSLAELDRLLARPADSPIDTAVGLPLRPFPGTVDQLYEWAAGASPELGEAGLATDRAALAVSLAEKEYKPDFSVQAAYMNRGGLDPMWQAGIGVSLPVHRKRLSAGVAEARAGVHSAGSALESLRLQLRYRTQERFTQLKTTEKVAVLYAEGIVPQDRMSVEAALANYQTGQVPFIAALEALTTLYNDRATHLRLLASHEQTLATLEEAGLGASGMGNP